MACPKEKTCDSKRGPSDAERHKAIARSFREEMLAYEIDCMLAEGGKWSEIIRHSVREGAPRSVAVHLAGRLVEKAAQAESAATENPRFYLKKAADVAIAARGPEAAKAVLELLSEAGHSRAIARVAAYSKDPVRAVDAVSILAASKSYSELSEVLDGCSTCEPARKAASGAFEALDFAGMAEAARSGGWTCFVAFARFCTGEKAEYAAGKLIELGAYEAAAGVCLKRSSPDGQRAAVAGLARCAESGGCRAGLLLMRISKCGTRFASSCARSSRFMKGLSKERRMELEAEVIASAPQLKPFEDVNIVVDP